MRKDGRKPDELREIKVELGYLDYPFGSCLLSMGKTRVLCSVTVENKVPHFLINRGQGWLTAEYALLPGSTHERIQREANTGRLTGRTQEIRRFIGRSLRPIFDLKLVGERTFIIDCDVIQADGGTRTASVIGAFLALNQAIERLNANHRFSVSPILDQVAAVSLGVINNELRLDLCYEEDSQAEIDMNLVMTGRGKIIEIQATAEKMPVSKIQLQALIELGHHGIKQIIELEKKIIARSRT